MTVLMACGENTDIPSNTSQEDTIEELVQFHISLSNPHVGQQSNYIYHQRNDLITFSDVEYTDNNLRVKIIDQLSDNKYLIEEAIDTTFGILTVPTYPQMKVLRNVWRFENDSLFVEPYENEYFGSFVWNLQGVYLEPDGYGFSLLRPTSNFIDMLTDYISDLSGWWGVGFANDYSLFGHLFEELITDKVSYNALDGPIKFRVYNLNDGLIRSMDFYSGGSITTHGFDLVLHQ